MNSEFAPQHPSEPKEISLKDLFSFINRYYRFLLSRALLIFSISLLGGLIGLAYAYWKKPRFSASTTFVLESGENTPNLG